MRGRVGDLLVALEGVYGRRGWQGPGVLGSIRGLAPKDAARRPKGARHSIQDLVEHIAFWEDRGIVFIRPDHTQARGDWGAHDRSFAQSVARLKSVHARLMGCVRGLSEQDLDKTVQTGEGAMSLAKALHGVVAHAAYHTGQIRLLRTLL